MSNNDKGCLDEFSSKTTCKDPDILSCRKYVYERKSKENIIF